MCAIYGWNLKPSVDYKQRIALAQILMDESERCGGDSWGYVVPIHGIRKARIHRDLGSLTKHTKPDELAEHSIVYGHCRRASVGEVSKKNAHPFCANHIVGAHVGHVNNYYTLNQTYGRKCTVDSHHIFYHLSENKPLTDLQGSGAVWYLKL